MLPFPTTNSSQEPTLRVQINHIDHTLIHPGPLDNSSLPRVPVLRIYGPSSTGKKACVYVHQVYPYFFVEYSGRLKPRDVNRYIAKLTLSLNHAISVSLKRNPHSPNSQYIRAILLVKGVHFYGFHSSYSPFLKILIADPAFVNRTVAIMQSGTVMQTRFRVFEGHLSFPLQFMSDFGLYGCGWIDLGEVLQRGSEDQHDGKDEQMNNDIHATFDPSPHFRQSRMPFEMDVVAHQILNRHFITARNIHHKLEIPAPLLPAEPLVLSVRELWEDERNRRRANGLNPSPEIPVDPSEQSRGTGGGWVAEARWWEEIRKRIERERETAAGKGVEVKESEKGWEKWVMTTFESVEALWEEPWKVWKPGVSDVDAVDAERGDKEQVENPIASQGGSVAWNVPDDNAEERVDIDVDETMLSSQEMSQLVEGEEAEAEWETLLGDYDPQPVGEEHDEHIYDYDDPHDPDDGPLQQDDTDDTDLDQNTPSPSDPFQENSSNRLPDPLQKSELKSASSADFDSAHSDGPVTPTKKVLRIRPVPASANVTPTMKGKTTSQNPTVPVTEEGRHQQVAEAAREALLSHTNHNPPSTSSQQFGGMSVFVQPDRYGDGEPLEELQTNPHFDSDGTRPSKRPKRSANGDRGPHSSDPFLNSSLSSSDQTSRSSVGGVASVRLSHPFTMNNTPNMNGYLYSPPPPSTSDLLASLDDLNIPSKIYRSPYYSKKSDAPERSREYAGLLYHLKGGEGLANLDDWDDGLQKGKAESLRAVNPAGVGGWEYASSPPSMKTVKTWLMFDNGKSSSGPKRSNPQSQIEGPTQAIKTTPDITRDATSREKQNMTILSLEVFAPSRGERVPDADVDELVALFYSFQDSDTDFSDGAPSFQTGKVVVQTAQLEQRRLRGFELDVVPDELELINRIVDIVVDLDPDIIVGWEVQTGSWGYLNARGRSYGFDVADLISRAPARRTGGGTDQWGIRHTSSFKVVGRHVLNLWRIMRVEQTLNMYTFENVAFHVLHRRIPRYSFSTLTEWYNSTVPSHTASVIRYFADRSSMALEILEEAEVITKTAEFARVFGVDFFSVISRGSQFKVESFMFRIAKPENFVLLSPSKNDVGKQNAAECMPLIMEPLSAFYTSPLVVLDFQSLYPSIMIAYNYCYSTCLGRITDFKGRNKFGVTELDQSVGLLETLQDQIHVAPNGIMYVKPYVRKGLLGRMLVELLETRVMVKQAMKSVKEDKALKRILDARQRSLKYICNVTYGYTSATYSGRMPAVEIADSIVQSGRETLEKAIRMINSTKKWGGEVVYGDTDSVFVYLRGKTKEQAFRIGHDIADTITALNPSPIKLKFEKVYLPCVLMAKKRYVGFKYENADDKEATFDAKGIETVRRDGVLAQRKMTENCLKIFFRTQDLTEVKNYCCRSWMKILENKASIQDFIFAKEVRMGTYSDKAPPPPGVTVAARRMMQDPNDEPQYGERVPYVIIRGQPNSRLLDRAVAPLELLDNCYKHIDAGYYISRVLIPPLERIFNLVGADARRWYDDMPKSIRIEPDSFSPTKIKPDTGVPNRLNIDKHFRSSQCLICGALASEGICDDCYLNPQTTTTGLLSRIRASEKSLMDAQRICASCTGSTPPDTIRCVSLDCPWLYERKKSEGKVEFLTVLREMLSGLETDDDDPSFH